MAYVFLSHPSRHFATKRAVYSDGFVITLQYAGVAELVDALGLGPSAARRGGSSPFTRTIFPSFMGLK